LVGIALRRKNLPQRLLDAPHVLPLGREEQCSPAGFDCALVCEAIGAPAGCGEMRFARVDPKVG
jgi:hypothetical protein